MSKKLYLLISILVVFSLALMACSSDSTTQSTDEAGNGQENGQANESANNASDYPSRTIEIYVGHGAGGGTDIFARTIGELLEDILGVNINVVNLEGAGGVIAKEHVANQPADGYTIAAISSFPVSTALGTNPAGLDVLTPIARVQADTYTIMVRSDQFEDLDEFLKYAEENPGQVRIGGVSTGSMDEINAARFIDATGLDMAYVPFDGSGDMQAALLGGHVEAILEELGPVIDYVDSGEIKPIIVFAEERLDEFPDVPTTVENGWDLTQGVERGFAIHIDTPQEIIDLLEDAIRQAYETEAYKEHEKQRYLHLREGWLGSQEYREKLEQDIAIYREVIQQLESQ
ncbi:putative tricarboxylic transport membrane protein [Caldalkalibacillus uzonensis]|uniref:Tricarboxylic transport membrane protein n=1 Tax=Caldalkalibacillus uzonensis TaxID=353224 RepID=A0ABU0CP51_9BACI|nr:tripartite tricarboxylate transporter substrate binding protein [Caldalkalibacillus uzonensis]MDQ0338196.1 putative tricarboxylic transport membrane protein [Caldalkalibacillus uzonensis]